MSRSSTSPQEMQECVRSDNSFFLMAPHREQVLDVSRGLTFTNRRPASSALTSMIEKNVPHAASVMDLERPVENFSIISCSVRFSTTINLFSQTIR